VFHNKTTKVSSENVLNKYLLHVKARANGANMLAQHCPTLLGPTCWRRLHTLLPAMLRAVPTRANMLGEV